jgi:hypothetical protein
MKRNKVIVSGRQKDKRALERTKESNIRLYKNGLTLMGALILVGEQFFLIQIVSNFGLNFDSNLPIQLICELTYSQVYIYSSFL